MRSLAVAMLVVLLHAPAFAAPEHLFMLSGQQRVAQVAFSTDGRTLATLQETWVCLWDVRGGSLRAAIVADRMELYRAIAFSPDGSTLAVGVHNRGTDPATVQLFDVAKASRKASYPLRVAADALAFSPDGALVACGLRPEVEVLEVAGGAKRWTLGSPQQRLSGTVHALCFSKSGTRLAAGLDGIVQVWDLGAQSLICTLRGRSVNAVTALAMDPRSDRVAAGLTALDVFQGEQRLWDAAPRPDGLAWSPDGALLASASREPALFNAADGKPVRPLAGPRIPGLDDIPAYAAAFSPSGKCVATAGSWGTRVWDAASGRILLALYSWPPEGGKVPWVAATADYWFTGSPAGQKNVRWRTANGNMNPAGPRLKPAAVKKAAAKVR